MRFYPSRKQAILLDINSGRISRQDAMTKYNLSEEELHEWANAYAFGGVDGFKLRNFKQRRRYVAA